MPLLPVSDLEKISPLLRGKVGNAIAAYLRKLFSVSKLSDCYDKNFHFQGPDFARAMLESLEIDYEVGGADRLADLPDGPFITISNHPYGGIDGIILVDLIGNARENYKVMVNEFLGIIEPLRSSWIVVNPKNNASGGVTGRNIQGVKEVLTNLQSGNPVGFFPSGAVSDFKIKGFRIRDREWQEPLVRLLKKAGAPIVPIRFFDRNSSLFYILGLINWRLRSLRLPHEIVNKRKARVRVGIGETLTPEEQATHTDIKEYGEWLRDSVYGMKLPDKFDFRDYSFKNTR